MCTVECRLQKQDINAAAAAADVFCSAMACLFARCCKANAQLHQDVVKAYTGGYTAGSNSQCLCYHCSHRSQLCSEQQHNACQLHCTVETPLNCMLSCCMLLSPGCCWHSCLAAVTAAAAAAAAAGHLKRVLAEFIEQVRGGHVTKVLILGGHLQQQQQHKCILIAELQHA
jgi:hypothetical protein